MIFPYRHQEIITKDIDSLSLSNLRLKRKRGNLDEGRIQKRALQWSLLDADDTFK
jgi:hypothetical protein